MDVAGASENERKTFASDAHVSDLGAAGDGPRLQEDGDAHACQDTNHAGGAFDLWCSHWREFLYEDPVRLLGCRGRYGGPDTHIALFARRDRQQARKEDYVLSIAQQGLALIVLPPPEGADLEPQDVTSLVGDGQ